MNIPLLKDKIAIVTGASSGIGKETAKLFAAEGAKVVLAARRLERLEALKEEINAAGGEAYCVQADVSKEADCIRIVEAAIAQYGRIDILVNNAGIADGHYRITKCSNERWDDVRRVNMDSIFFTTREALKYMEGTGKGSIINVSSIGGTRATAGISYSAVKAGVNAMTKNIAIQYAGQGIRCNAVCPGPTETELFTSEAMQHVDQEFVELTGEHMYIKAPPAQAIDQANAILYFASDLSTAVTGQILVVDHGCTL